VDISAPGRQSGTDAILGYTWWLNPNGTPPPSVTDVGIYTGKALLGGHCTVTPSRNFTDHGDFSIEFDVDIVTNLDTHYFSIGFGKNAENAGYEHKYGMEVLVGKFSGQSVYALSENGMSRLQIYPLPGVFTESNTAAKVKVCVLQSGFPPTNNCRVALFINDVAYPLNVTATESQFIHTLAIPPTNNYIVFENCNTDAALYPMTIDNLVISTLESNTLNTTAWTGDINSGLDSSKVYTHAVSFGDISDANINGIIFDGSAGNMSGDNWELKTASSVPLSGPTASVSPNVSPSSVQLVSNYMESVISSNAGALVISELTPGLNYKLSLFSVGFEAVGGRKSYFASTSGINLPLLEQDEFSDKNGQLLTINFTAPSDGIFSFSTTPETTSTPAWNWYAFCNEVMNAPDAIYATQGAYTDKVHVYWTEVPGAESYIVYRADTNDLTSTNISWEVTTDYYDDSSVAVAQNYYYWVAAANTGGVSSVTGSAMGFTASAPPDTPSAIFPNGNTVTSPVEFTASAYNDGSGFAFAASQWQVASDSGFSSIKWDTGENGPAITSILASPISIPEGTNYWRVRYMNEKNTGLGALFYADGTFQFYDGATLLHTQSGAVPGAQEFHVFITTSTDDFDEGDPAYCSVFVNGTPLINNGAFNKYGYTLSDGFVKNYVTMYNYNGVGTSPSLVDNLKISVAPTNVISVHPWTGDADSLIDPTKEYTHSPNLTGQSFLLGQFGAIGAGSPAIMLSGLTPNSSNTLYIYSWARNNATDITFPSSYGGAVDLIDVDQYGQLNGIIVQYDYIADENGKFAVAATSEIDSLRFFICGFANLETGAQNPQIDVDNMIAFGEVANGGNKSLPLEIANIGGGIVDGTITGISAPFSLATNDYYAVPGTNDNISVTFSPTEERVYTNVITLTGNGGAAEVTLTGSGIPEPAILWIIGLLELWIVWMRKFKF